MKPLKLPMSVGSEELLDVAVQVRRRLTGALLAGIGRLAARRRVVAPAWRAVHAQLREDGVHLGRRERAGRRDLREQRVQALLLLDIEPTVLGRVALVPQLER